MSLKREESGRRSVQVEVEVPGTPEEVWKAIATGPGISAWFVPTDVEEREGGSIVCHMGPGMDSVATVTSWDAPHRFAAESGDLGPKAPPLATEWTVEARSGGNCIVRVVHSLFASTDDWDEQLESFESGWPGFFQVLRLYLTHFRGLSCSAFRVTGSASGSAAEVWSALADALGFAGATEGQAWRTPSSGTPVLAGTVELVSSGEQHCRALLRLDEPTPGIASPAAFAMGGRVHVGLSFYLYGDEAAEVARRTEPAWQAWISRTLP